MKNHADILRDFVENKSYLDNLFHLKIFIATLPQQE